MKSKIRHKRIPTNQKLTHRLVVAKRKVGGMDWEFGVHRCNLLHLEGINKGLLYTEQETRSNLPG